MFVLLFLFVFFISLFILYAVSRHDFVLLRQSISLRQVFDIFFVSFFVFFITSRIGWAVYTQSMDILNPLRFFYLSKYWGILPFIGIIGIIASILFLFRKKKNKLRILDIYFISLTPIIVLDVLLKSNTGILIIIKLIALLVLIMFYSWFVKIHNKFTTKDGFITCLTIITYSLVSLSFSIASSGVMSQKYLWFNILLVAITVTASIVLFFVQKDTFNKH